MNQEELLTAIVDYFRSNIFEPHLNKLENTYAQLTSYSVNPFITPYLSKIITNSYDARGSASALYFSRVLSTSITTTFGNHIRQILVNNELASPLNSRSHIISFTDKTTGSSTVCLLKSGPNTINAGDKAGIHNKMDSYHNYDNKAIGIIYGNAVDLNTHYQDLENDYEIFVGSDFWHRITGYPNFYNDLTERLRHEVATLDTQDRLQNGLTSLEGNIDGSELFGF